MKCDLVKSCGSSKLVAFFSGFASDSSILSRAKLPQGFDAVVFCDYRDLNCDFDFSKYSEVFVVAWSFGVRVADMFADRFIGLAFFDFLNQTGMSRENYLGSVRSIFYEFCSENDMGVIWNEGTEFSAFEHRVG